MRSKKSAHQKPGMYVAFVRAEDQVFRNVVFAIKPSTFHQALAADGV
jgi:hypothetical protein